MKLTKQLCTLDQAKRLKYLGITAKPSFYFHVNQSGFVIWLKTGSSSWRPVYDTQGEVDVLLGEYMIGAWTVAELGIMLPIGNYPVPDHLEWFSCPIENGIKAWEAWWENLPWGLFGTEAEARAALLIHLLENKIITPESVNQRIEQ